MYSTPCVCACVYFIMFILVYGAPYVISILCACLGNDGYGNMRRRCWPIGGYTDHDAPLHSCNICSAYVCASHHSINWKLPGICSITKFFKYVLLLPLLYCPRTLSINIKIARVFVCVLIYLIFFLFCLETHR